MQTWKADVRMTRRRETQREDHKPNKEYDRRYSFSSDTIIEAINLVITWKESTHRKEEKILEKP